MKPVVELANFILNCTNFNFRSNISPPKPDVVWQVFMLSSRTRYHFPNCRFLSSRSPISWWIVLLFDFLANALSFSMLLLIATCKIDQIIFIPVKRCCWKGWQRRMPLSSTVSANCILIQTDNLGIQKWLLQTINGTKSD